MAEMLSSLSNVEKLSAVLSVLIDSGPGCGITMESVSIRVMIVSLVCWGGGSDSFMSGAGQMDNAVDVMQRMNGQQ